MAYSWSAPDCGVHCSLCGLCKESELQWPGLREVGGSEKAEAWRAVRQRAEGTRSLWKSRRLPLPCVLGPWAHCWLQMCKAGVQG